MTRVVLLARHKQLHRVFDRERVERDHELAVDAEWYLAGREHAQPGATASSRGTTSATTSSTCSQLSRTTSSVGAAQPVEEQRSVPPAIANAAAIVSTTVSGCDAVESHEPGPCNPIDARPRLRSRCGSSRHRPVRRAVSRVLAEQPDELVELDAAADKRRRSGGRLPGSARRTESSADPGRAPLFPHAQLGPRVETQLLAEQLTDARIRRERVGLAAILVAAR